MLKKRIIPIQLLLNGRLVKPQQFGQFRDVGDPDASSKVYNSQDADELIFLNIDRRAASIQPLLDIIEDVSSVCFMPLALGGGIRSAEDAARLIRAGADKIVLNSICYRQPEIIREVAECYGSQAVIVAVDVRWNTQHDCYQLYSLCGTNLETTSLEEHIERCIQLGAGELLIQSIDRDGMMEGFDVQLAKIVMSKVDVPVIICGGAGHYNHLKDVFLAADVSAVACGSLFNFSDSNLIRAKAFLSNYQLPFKVV